MEKKVIFLRTFILCTIIGVFVEVIIYLINPHDYNLVFAEIAGDIVINVLLGLIMVYLFKDEVNSTSEQVALAIMNRNNADITSCDKMLVGKLGRYKRLFMGDIVYDRASHMIKGPKMLIK